jgi:hypothetical protein
MPNYTGQGLTRAEEEAMRLNALKLHQQKLEKMEDDGTKFCGLICQRMSAESKDEVAKDPDYEVWSDAMDPKKLWQAIVKTHKVGCVSSVDTVKELETGKSYQTIEQDSFETLALYSERFRETYQAYKVTDGLASQIVIKEPDQAMDFFHGLDQAKYGEFKQNVQNGWAMKSMKPPQTVNEVYQLAGVWVKPNARNESGTAAWKQPRKMRMVLR